MELPLTSDYTQLFLQDTPLIDVRAPVEFSQGAFPMASNLPLMNDAERHAVGIRYKEQGQEHAIQLGHELVQGSVKHQRVTDWTEFTSQNPAGALYCFRGGLRSKISQQWIYEQTGTLYPRVKGGYKAMRHFLMDEIETATRYFTTFIVGGRTGCGKTLLLDRVKQKVDLEKIYHHRGSAFGSHVHSQPSQIDAENKLAIEFLKHRHAGIEHIILEDEAANIGSRRIPTTLFNLMKSSPLLLLETELQERIDNIFNEYITESLTEYVIEFGADDGFNQWSQRLLDSLRRIQRRLGGDRYKRANDLMQAAIDEQRSSGNEELHKEWIQFILKDYYDPMYDFQLNKKKDRVIYQGPADAIIQYLTDKYQLI